MTQTQQKEAETAENVMAEGSIYNNIIFQLQRLRLHYCHVTVMQESSTWHAPIQPQLRVSQNLAPQLVRMTAGPMNRLIIEDWKRYRWFCETRSFAGNCEDLRMLNSPFSPVFPVMTSSRETTTLRLKTPIELTRWRSFLI